MSVEGGPDIVNDGLVLYLDAGNTKSYPGSGTTWKDLSGNGNDGTLVNGVGFDSENLGSLTFDGSNDYVIISNSSNLLSFGQNDFTLVIAYYNNALDNDYHHFFSMDDQDNFAWKATRGSEGLIYFYGGSNSYRSFLGDYGDWSLDYNKWSIHTFVRSGSVHIGYKNGVKQGEVVTSFTKDLSATNIFLGRRGLPQEYSQHKRSFNLVYNRALTPQEILQNYNATKGRYGL